MGRSSRPGIRMIAIVAVILARAASATAQTTYHLHQEQSGLSTAKQLKVADPDTAAFTITSTNYKNITVPVQAWLAQFETQTGVPNAVGTIPSGSIVSMSFWQRKSANWGTLFPLGKITLNSAVGAELCTATGTTAMTTTLVFYTISCTLQSAVPINPSDRFYLQVGSYITVSPGNHNLTVSLSIEGTLNGNYDSLISVPAITPPPPIISGVSPVWGVGGTSVQVTGQYFGTSQGSSTIRFNGVNAAPSSWSNTTISVPVPPAATTGPITVTVGGQSSNGVGFSVFTTGSIQGSITRLSDGTGIVGALVEALQSGAVKGSATSAGGGAYTIPSLLSGQYDIRSSASGFVTKITTGVALSGSSATANAALALPGTISGQVTSSGLPVQAGLNLLNGETVVAMASAGPSGAYSFANLPPGTYSIEASAVGYQSVTHSGLVLSEGGSLQVNLIVSPAASGVIRYSYDELGRLKSVVDLAGETAVYSYDAAGNVLSINRQLSSAVSVIAFSPQVGPVGSNVTIIGTGFSAVAAENTVRVNGTAALVTSATSTQILATVPTGATTGSISVEAPAGSATSSGAFTVGATLSPTVTGFAPSIATSGTAVTISGTNFNPVATLNAVKMNITGAAVGSSTATSISTTVPVGARIGRVSVATANGVGASAEYLYVPSSPYGASDVAVTAALPIGTTVPIAVPVGKLALLGFDGIGGKRVRVHIDDPQPTCDWSRWIYADPTPLFGTGGLIGDQNDLNLRYTGTYTIVLLAGSGASPCTANVTVTNLP